MEWKSIESQHDLDELDTSIYWEDSETIEYHATLENKPYFPLDISRSGWINKNIRILVKIVSHTTRYCEFVLIDCDHFTSVFAENVSMKGRVDSLKRIEIVNYKGSLQMRCSRMIYRFLGEPADIMLNDRTHLHELISSIDSYTDLKQFLWTLESNYREHPEEWENDTLGSFLEALAAWVNDADGYFANRGEVIPRSPSWKFIAIMLLASKVYE